MSLLPYLLKQDNNRPSTEGSDMRIKRKGHWLALVTTSQVGLVVVSNVLKHFWLLWPAAWAPSLFHLLLHPLPPTTHQRMPWNSTPSLASTQFKNKRKLYANKWTKNTSILINDRTIIFLPGIHKCFRSTPLETDKPVVRDYISTQTTIASLISILLSFLHLPVWNKMGFLVLYINIFRLCLVGQACQRVLFIAPERCSAYAGFPHNIS